MQKLPSRDAAYAKMHKREESLSDIDFAKANRYERFGLYAFGSFLVCLVPTLVSISFPFHALFFYFVLFSWALASFCFGLTLFFHGRATVIRGYEHNKFFSNFQDHPFIYDGTARTSAWLQLLAAYIIMGFGVVGCLAGFAKYFGLW